jgi:hypothetical protein
MHVATSSAARCGLRINALRGRTSGPTTGLLLVLAIGSAAAQQPQAVAPPQAQAWIDVATYSGSGMMGAMMGAAAGGGGLGGMIGGALGGLGLGTPKNDFGRTQAGPNGHWVDVTLMVRANPSLAEAQMAVPSGFQPSPLKLVSPKQAQTRRVPEGDDETIEPQVERPKGRLLLYWGCGAQVRAGQPRVLDFANLSAADAQRFFVSRSATQRGAHLVPGRPVWPNPEDSRMLPQGASLVGEHAFSGAGVPEGFRFQIAPPQDLMPPMELQQQSVDGAFELRWNPMPTARGWFLSALGGKGENEVVFWTSSEQPETGSGLVDYQTNPAVDRWVREKVLLPAATTTCTVPRGIFDGGMGMLRGIGYGSEIHYAHPPRPSDAKVRWEPVWTAKVRVKTVVNAMLGDAQAGGATPRAAGSGAEKPDASGGALPKPMDVLRGILGR